jgi:hypothetical protein
MVKTKAQIADEIAATGADRPDPDDFTVAELQAMLDRLANPVEGQTISGSELTGAHDAVTSPVVQRRKVSRGNSRRIARAQAELGKALKAFRQEIGVLIYLADPDTGERVGDHELVGAAFAFEQYVNQELGAVLSPSADQATEGGE